MKRFTTALLSGIFSVCFGFAGNGYWQQQANYVIHAELNSSNHIITGTERIEYFNNSGDTLRTLYFHLYWNAIQVKSNSTRWAKEKQDFMTEEKLYKLKPGEEGYMLIKEMKVAGEVVTVRVLESILEVELKNPLLPHSNVMIDADFEAQVPVTIRRSGRDNPAGTDYSMCQWYPKICRYDKYGWHADPYIGREFAGTFGNFDVTIRLDKKYTVAGTGVLQNKQYLEEGYTGTEDLKKEKKTDWHFTAENVHDFAWVADDDFFHTVQKIDGIDFHFFYHKTEKYAPFWQDVIDNLPKAYSIAKENFGAYPYPQFSFTQAGEGYMEYPMCTFLESGDDASFISTAYHEFMHSWYYGIFGTDENMFHWMDEGLTSYAEARLYYGVKTAPKNLNVEAIQGYHLYRDYAVEEPVSTFANYFATSEAYLLAAYYKGQLFTEQMRYIIGEENVKKGLLKYYDVWKFKHPEPDDFVRIMEEVSGIELSWYQNYWLNTTKTIDYSIESITNSGKSTNVTLKRIGELPMPVDIVVTYTDGSKQLYYIPLDLMYGKKPHDQQVYPYIRFDLDPWSFAVKRYEFSFEPTGTISYISIDPKGYTADVQTGNNTRQMESGKGKTKAGER